MAINMGLTLFFHMCFIITGHCLTSIEQMSKENINEVLDKLILQTQHINETDPTTHINDLTPINETHPGLLSNDSNIYILKTLVAPQINFKSSSEVVHGTRHSNKTVQSLEVSTDDHDPTSDDIPFAGAGKITRKIFHGATNKREFMPRLIHVEHGTSKSGNVNDNSLEDLFEQEIVAGINTTNDNKQISFTLSTGHQNQQLNLLHEYPEIIIDHITYDNVEDDNNSLIETKSVDYTQHVENVVKGEINNKVPAVQPRYNVPEEEFEVADEEHDIPVHFESRSVLTPEMTDLIDAIIQKKVMHDAFLKRTTKSESRQSMLLNKILQRLPEKIQMANNVQPRYSVLHERIAPVEMETLSHIHSSLVPLHSNGGNHLTNSYFNVPYVPSKWELHNHLLKKYKRLIRPNIHKHTRLVLSRLD